MYVRQVCPRIKIPPNAVGEATDIGLELDPLAGIFESCANDTGLISRGGTGMIIPQEPSTRASFNRSFMGGGTNFRDVEFLRVVPLLVVEVAYSIDLVLKSTEWVMTCCCPRAF